MVVSHAPTRSQKKFVEAKQNCAVLLILTCTFHHQPEKEVATAAVLVPQQALDSLVPKPPDKKDNQNQEPPKNLGTFKNLIYIKIIPVLISSWSMGVNKGESSCALPSKSSMFDSCTFQ